MSSVLFEAEDPAGRSLQIVAEDDGTLSVSIYAPGQEQTDWTAAFDDEAVEYLQVTLAAYIHHKRGLS